MSYRMQLNSLEGAPIEELAPVRLAPLAARARRPEAGPVLGIREKHLPRGSLPAALT